MAEYSEAFERFWAMWPDNGQPPFTEYTRKKNKPGCWNKWALKKLDKQADVIIRDVEKRKQYDKEWLKQNGSFMQGPLPYLNQENWQTGFADVRDDRKKVVDIRPPREFEEEGPFYSRWACYANKLLVRKFMQYKGNRGRLAHILKTKNDLVAQVERDARNGEAWDDDDFKEVMTRALDRAFTEDLSETRLLAKLHR